jgi:putative spermidine/putrescine transport system permease protein
MNRRLFTSVLGILVYIFMLLPVVLVIWMSFFDKGLMSFPPSGYSLKWYAGLTEHTDLFFGLLYSLEVAAIAAIIAVILGVLAALGVSRSRIRGKALLENTFVLPLVIPAIISGMAIYIYLYQVSTVLQTSMVPSTWALIAAHVMITVPWTFRLTYGGLASIGRDLEKASMDLGSRAFLTLWRVTLPLLRPSLIGAVIFAFVFSFGDLEISLFLISPGQTTLPVAMMQYTAFGIDPTLAAISTVQIVLIGALLLIGNKFVKFGEAFVGGTKQ